MAFMLIIAVLVSSTTAQSATSANDSSSSLPKFPNIGYLGRGYDILRGTPRPIFQPVDAGFVSSVFDMSSYKQGRQTADGQHAVPDYTDIVECTACQLSFETNVIKNPADFLFSLYRQVKPDANTGPFGPFSFGASEAYIRTAYQTNQLKKILVDTSVSCIVYCAEMQSYVTPPLLDAAFVEAVTSLPVLNISSPANDSSQAVISASQEELNAYLTFLQRFGTHVVVAMRAGSMFWQRATFSNHNFSAMELGVADVGVETAAGLAFLNSTLRYMSPYEATIADNFRLSASSIIYHSIGAPVNIGQSAYNATSRWITESQVTPMPVEFRLVPLTFLLTNVSFPTESLTNILTKRAVLMILLNNGTYCHYLAGLSIGISGTINCPINGSASTSAGTGTTSGSSAALILQPSSQSNYGGLYYQSGVDEVSNVVNPLTGTWSCPTGYTALPIAGGSYFIEMWPGGNCYPDGSSQSVNRRVQASPTIPGTVTICLNGTDDPQHAFFGFFTAVNSPCWGPFSHWQCEAATTCCGNICRKPGSVGRDALTGHGEHVVLVAYFGCEYVYASFTKQAGAYVGGFYLIDSRPQFSWVNPATGTLDCAAAYRPYLLFSQTTMNSTLNVFPFQSFVCLLNSPVK